MKTITVAELRQNPTEALADVEAGETYEVTRHRRTIARLVPPAGEVDMVPPKRRGRSHLADRPRHHLRTAESVDDLLADMESPW